MRRVLTPIATAMVGALQIHGAAEPRHEGLLGYNLLGYQNNLFMHPTEKVPERQVRLSEQELWLEFAKKSILVRSTLPGE
jgi:hypothetical protein